MNYELTAEQRTLVDTAEVQLVPIEKIGLEDRERQVYEGIDELGDSIKKVGLLQPINVLKIEPREDGIEFLVIAGGRRFKAMQNKGFRQVRVLICKGLSELSRKIMELSENLFRKDFRPIEETMAVARLHAMYVDLYGERISSLPNAPGHTVENTAVKIGKSAATVHRHIKMARLIEALPATINVGGVDIETKTILAGCATSSELEKLVGEAPKQTEELVRSVNTMESVERAGGDLKYLIDAYEIKSVKDYLSDKEEVFDLLYCDVPYEIALGENKTAQKKKSSKNVGNTNLKHMEYTETENFEKDIKITLTLCKKALKKSGWLILWFPYNYYFLLNKLTQELGFVNQVMPCIWYKGNSGTTLNPKFVLGSSYDVFLALRNSEKAEINKQGRGNVFQFNRDSKAWHPAQHPVDLAQEVIETFTTQGRVVGVPFAGSGSAILAAFKAKCLVSGCDLSTIYKASYVEMAKEFLTKVKN